MRERIEHISEQLLKKMESIVDNDCQLSIKDLVQLTQLSRELLGLLDGTGAASTVTVRMEGEVDGLAE